MTKPEHKRFDPGFINCVTHELTGAQILFYLMHTWATEPTLSVILWCREDAISKGNNLRVALSKERKERKLVRTFELRMSEPWPYTHMGIRGEAIKIERVAGTLQTRVQAAAQALWRF